MLRRQAATAPTAAGTLPHRDSKGASFATAIASIPAWVPLSLAAGLVLVVGFAYLSRAAATRYGRRRSRTTASVS